MPLDSLGRFTEQHEIDQKCTAKAFTELTGGKHWTIPDMQATHLHIVLNPD